MASYSYADVVERVFAEFEGLVPLPVIVEVAHVCRQQLSGSPLAAMPELLERLVRQRLISMLGRENSASQAAAGNQTTLPPKPRC